jgi:hypothetical protein
VLWVLLSRPWKATPEGGFTVILPISAACSRTRPHRMWVMASLAIRSDESRTSDPIRFLGERLVHAGQEVAVSVERRGDRGVLGSASG